MGYMSSPLDALADTVHAVRELWPGEQLDALAGADLVKVNNLLGAARRQLDAAVTKVTAEISRQSRPELGPESLAKKHGFRNANSLLSGSLGTTGGEAAKLIEVGEATAPRVLLTGERAPARFPHVAAALSAGRIGAAAASVITTMLKRVQIRAGAEAVDEAEQTLVAQAAGLSIDLLRKVVRSAEAYLDPEGVAAREEELRASRYLRMWEDPDGALMFNGRVGPEHAAPVKTVIEGFVTAELAAQRAAEASDDPDVPHRTIPMIQADALVRLCEHVLACEHSDVPLGGATVIVRVSLEDLENGTGHGTIDGLSAPISIGTVRRMAADGGVIPCVLGTESEIIDWGRQRRLFTKAQRRAICERDHGCARCGAPPGITKVHHIRWWSRGGTTDMNNGVLLCEACHHLIHDNGWDIRIEGVGTKAKVWFIPPAHVDPGRTPQLGVRHRYDHTAA
ncbi:HNH endonuclease signature motif containing protein [Microbacterium invictum]